MEKDILTSIEEQQESLIVETLEIAESLEDAVRILSEHLAFTHAFIDKLDLIGEYEEFINELMIEIQMRKD